ncbi:MAG: hypothetical protein ACX931_00240 [Saccharospirillum sp.]|jgi:hypothetical protein
MLTALILFGAAMVVIGAFMWVKPSPRDKHLAMLRAQALREGLKVHSIKLDDTSLDGRVEGKRLMLAVYCLPHAFDQTADMAFTVLRTSGVGGAFLPDGWKWASHRRAPEPYRADLTAFIETLPEAYLALEVRMNSVGVVWNERGDVDELPRMKERLSQLIRILSAKRT